MRRIKRRMISDLFRDTLNLSDSFANKVFSTQELTLKIFNSMSEYKGIKDKIAEFDKIFNYPFLKSLEFQLGRSMVKHCKAKEVINWKIVIRNNMIVNDNDNEKTTLETLSILTDYLNKESHSAMQRIKTECDHEFEGKLLTGMPCYDYNIVCPKGQLENYKSLLFQKENLQCIISYYLDFIELFPVTLQEFEKAFFYFLTFLNNEEKLIINSPIQDCWIRMRQINDIVKMRYINIKDRLILTFIHLILVDNELSSCSNAIYNEIKHYDDITREQLEDTSS